MTKFFFSHILKNFWRSFSLILSGFLIIITIFWWIYIFQNISSAINYYSTHGSNPNKLTLYTNSNLLNIFSKENSLNEDKINEIFADENFENTKVFRLVTIPVSAKFGFFNFGLESDIPVFSVTDSALTGAKTPVGMSRIMLDLYNTQFAWSSEFFPQMRDFFLIWQKIDFTFGKSKIFESSHKISDPITGTITTINNEFPGIGLILPESIVQSELQKIGYKLGSPYKIITEIKNINNKNKIEEKYKNIWIKTTFEIDEINETKEKINNIAIVIFGFGIIIISIIILFFIFLLSGFFRERKNIFQLISLFGLKSKKSYFMTMWEPIFLIIIGLFIGICTIFFIQKIIHTKIIKITESKWITFPIVFPSFWEILLIFYLSFWIILVLIFIMEIISRKKYKFC